jgi:PEP-CTERM motif
MKSFFLSLMLLLVATAAFANTVSDPGTIIRDHKCGSTCAAVGMSFSFTSTASNGGVFDFKNVSGSNWFNLKLTERGVPASAISCATNLFAACHVTTKNGLTTILVSGLTSTLTGIPNLSSFRIELHCPAGTKNCQPWPAGVNFHGVANVPEPGTLAMVATGIGVLINRRRKLFTA